jgi:hypothetical protein
MLTEAVRNTQRSPDHGQKRLAKAKKRKIARDALAAGTIQGG